MPTPRPEPSVCTRSRIAGLVTLSATVAVVGAALVTLTPPATARHSATPGATDQPVELGRVPWLRDLDAALAQAATSKKPALLLFDEVPGCHTCVSYGQIVLSHPLIVEAATTLFVPVAIYNNVEGADRIALKSFNEPEWNNPVVRIIDAKRTELAPRHDGDYTVGGLAQLMHNALASAGSESPDYLRLLAVEELATSTKVERATFAMHCFWEGEGKLGALNGVLSTTPGFLNGEEVVEVLFDPKALSFPTLAKTAQAMECASRVYARTDEQEQTVRSLMGGYVKRSDEAITLTPKDDKYYLLQSHLKSVPMTQLQATRINAALSARENPFQFLSPAQIALAERISANPAKAWPNFIGRRDFATAWDEAQAAAAK